MERARSEPGGVGQHVYAREIQAGERTSLSVIAGRIGEGATVLDLGTGSGAIGRFLTESKGCTVDGVTHNAEEARLAKPHYRSLVVADLEQCDLTELFGEKRYGYVVCADVLEHVRAPERVVQACRELLAADGKLLISMPNTGYAGLIAELMTGEFRYREEGLLDATHVRHFTRQTLLRFLTENGYSVEAIEPVVRVLPESEFAVAFDSLPPAVSRYLLAAPDAQTYQLIAVARPLASGERPNPVEQAQRATENPADALFTCQLFPGLNGEYSEANKLVARGVIGRERQTVRFALPQETEAHDALRFDPADRPGFLHLYRMRLLAADGSELWQWDCERDGVGLLAGAHCSQIVLQPPWLVPGVATALLHGEDPWIELRLPEAALRASGGGAFEAVLGWPMSADYATLARAVEEQEARHAAQQRATEARIDQLTAAAAEAARARESLDGQLAATTERANASVRELETARARIGLLNSDIGALQAQADASREQHDRLGGQLAALRAQNDRLGRHLVDLRQQKQALLSRCNTLSRERDGAVAHIETIEKSTVFRATRPVVHAKMAVDRLLGRSGAVARGDSSADAAAGPEPSPLVPVDRPVDVIVPVYRGLADTKLCVESVLGSRCQTPYRLVLINDASPEPELTQYLRDAAGRENRITLLENDENLGFVGTVNRGMALSGENDVLLLNSDTEVADGWLDRLRASAYRDEKIASVTPFSNNATICSYPRFCADNELPAGWDTARLDALFARVNAGQAVDVPTGIGFCMYIRRDALDAIGLFDVENFGKGYGEENDFCQRAIRAGWRNVHALDTFVMHSGGVSFGDSKSPREQAAMETLRRLHPTYETQVHSFLAADPARLARLSVDLARARTPHRPTVLAVLHDRGGGTVRHVRELAEHIADQASFFTLRPAGGGDVLLELAAQGEAFALSFHLPHQFDELIAALRALEVRLVHYHHLIGHDDLVMRLPERLGVPYDFTTHDFYVVCPQITLTFGDQANRYCEEQGIDQCHQCLRRSPAPGGLEIETWRSKYGTFLRGARNALSPSRDAIAHLEKYVPTAPFQYVAHTDILTQETLPAPAPERLSPDAPLKVVVIGALSPIKGADVLEDVATLAAKRSAGIDFHLIGFGYRALRTQPRARLTVHGAYEEKDLPQLLDWLQPDLVWFPALWPETYSYTLSACLRAGLPVAACDLGAFPERLANRSWTWIRPWNQPASEWLAFFEEIRERHFVTGKAPKPLIPITPAGSGTASGRNWSYRECYLEGIEVDPTGTASRRDPGAAPDSPDVALEPSFLEAHLPDRNRGGLHLKKEAKGRLLHAALRLRAAPGLSRVVRSIPLRWQTRLKTWLRA